MSFFTYPLIVPLCVLAKQCDFHKLKTRINKKAHFTPELNRVKRFEFEISKYNKLSCYLRNRSLSLCFLIKWPKPPVILSRSNWHEFMFQLYPRKTFLETNLSLNLFSLTNVYWNILKLTNHSKFKLEIWRQAFRKNVCACEPSQRFSLRNIGTVNWTYITSQVQ